MSPTVLYIWTEQWWHFWQVNLPKWSLPLWLHLWNTAANERGKYLGYLGSTKCLSLRWFVWLCLKGEVFDFSAWSIVFLSQSSGASGLLLWSQEEVPGSSPWELTPMTLKWENTVSLRVFSVGFFQAECFEKGTLLELQMSDRWVPELGESLWLQKHFWEGFDAE